MVNCIKEFSSLSGLKMNINKSLLFPLKTCRLIKKKITRCSYIPVIELYNTVTYLRVIIHKDENERNVLNFKPIINKIKIKCNIRL